MCEQEARENFLSLPFVYSILLVEVAAPYHYRSTANNLIYLHAMNPSTYIQQNSGIIFGGGMMYVVDAIAEVGLGMNFS